MPREDRDRRLPFVRTEEERREERRRRAEATWYAWALTEFARYSYALGLLAVVLFAPLQMADAWLPAGRPAVVSPAVVALVAAMVDAAALYFGVRGYTFLWAEGGLVDRAIQRHEAQAEDREGH